MWSCPLGPYGSYIEAYKAAYLAFFPELGLELAGNIDSITGVVLAPEVQPGEVLTLSMGLIFLPSLAETRSLPYN